MQQVVLKPRIVLTEEYAYKSKISGVRQTKLNTVPMGHIDVMLPYDDYSRALEREKDSNSVNPLDRLLVEPIGYLRCDHYGQSNLEREPGLTWERDLLPIKIDFEASELVQLSSAQDRFDLRLTQTYRPNEPKTTPLEVSVHIVDEDSEADESDTESLIKELQKQADIKRSLVMKFRVTLFLPESMDLSDRTALLQISSMRLRWPIATPHRLVKLRVGSTLYPSIRYNPERGEIECNNIPFKFDKIDMRHLAIYRTDEISLEVSEPIEIYENTEVHGSVSLELRGLLSGLELDYCNLKGQEQGDVLITQSTVLRNDFVLDLEEGLQNKRYSPRQHLHFPGVVLNQMRIADVIMLLEDKGFEVIVRSEDETSIIKAKRSEGARDIEVFMLIQGTNAETTREREIAGQAKYITALPVGATRIYIQGKLQGDSKRIVNVINEIQKQLKEQFRHVGTAE